MPTSSAETAISSVNVLQITPTNVYPPSDGGQHRSHGLVASFPDHGDEVYRYCQGGHLANYVRGDWKQTLDIATDYQELQQLHPLFDLARLPELFGLPNVFLGRSLRLVKPSVVIRRIDWADVILVELPWQVPAVAELTERTPVVYSSHNVEQERFESTSDSRVGAAFSEKVSRIERAAIQRSDAVVCTSERDRSEYRQRYDVEVDYLISPNGVSRDIVRNKQERSQSNVRSQHGISERTIGLFIGTDYGPNREAARHVIRIASEATATGLDIHFMIVGSVGESISTEHDNVTLTGFVPELEPYVAAADIGLIPIESGSGTNIKLLEYLAKRLPVVTTEFGRRGFRITHGQEALVVPASEFTAAIEQLVTDAELRQHLSENGVQYVQQNHLWEDISSELRTQLKRLVSSARQN